MGNYIQEQSRPERMQQEVKVKGDVGTGSKYECVPQTTETSNCLGWQPYGLQVFEYKLFSNYWLTTKLCKHQSKP